MTTPLRILAIFAHPDDPEFIIGGSLACWADEGAQLKLCIVTDGSAGSNDPNQDLAELISLREVEERAASAVLGVQEVVFLGYKDGTLQPTLELRRDLTRLIRDFKPDRVVISDPTAVLIGDGYINHPDHRAVAEAALYAVFPSAETRPIFPELLAEGYEPHKVKEVYITDGDYSKPTHVDISNTIDRKIQALLCHKSQVGDDVGPWVREWAAEAGKAAGVAYAETFRVMKFVNEEPQEHHETPAE